MGGGGGVCLRSSRPRYNAPSVVIISSSTGDLKINTHTHVRTHARTHACTHTHVFLSS